MKRLLYGVHSVALGLLADVRVAYPQLRGVDRDCERLTLNCTKRGLGFFTLDLPSLDSVLLDGLKTGSLRLSGPLTRVVSKRIHVPRFLSGLWLLVFNNTGCLRSDADPTAIAFMRQLFNLGKRLELECTPSRLEKAKKEYHDVERQIRQPSLSWGDDELDPDCRGRTVHLRDSVDTGLPLFPKRFDLTTSQLLERCQQVADIVLGRFSFFEPVTFTGNRQEDGKKPGLKHGPGAVAERRGIFNKYIFVNWSAKLEPWFPFDSCGTTAGSNIKRPANYEAPSRLIAVPKTAKAPRLIAAEPTEHQWCQQVILRYMTDELRKLFGSDFIDFSRQDLSGEMALSASLNGHLATIDLSSASDRLSCWLVERIFRGNQSLLHALHASRTRWLRDEHLGETIFIKLNKFASQGTAVTFPVQTLVYLCIALGACIQGKPTWTKINRLRSSIRVFGDDIIVPNYGYASTRTALEALGLKVNDDKSFNSGHFRESCGTDGFYGYNVTPVKPKVLVDNGPKSRQALLDTSNNFFMKGYWRAAEAVSLLLPKRVASKLPVVPTTSGITGFKSFVGADLSHLSSRWNSNLHYREYRVWRVKSRSTRVNTGGFETLLQYFTEAPDRQPGWQSGVASRPEIKDNLGWEPLLV